LSPRFRGGDDPRDELLGPKTAGRNGIGAEQDGKRFLLRSPPRPATSLALRAAGVALPPTVRQLADA